MSLYQYPNQRYTSQLGLSLYGMDEILAENFLLIDGTFGAGSTVNVNGTLVANPNFGSLPAAPVGDTNVTFQVDSNGNVSAYAPTPAAAGVTSITGDSVVYNNVASTGAVTLSLIAQAAFSVLAGPNAAGPNATPTFRALVAADIPALPYLPSSTVLPATTSRTAHEFFGAYTASTGTFTSYQPAVADLSDTPAANLVLAGPASGSAATATFRALVAADIPPLPYGSVTSVSSGNIDTIITVSVATPTSTPAISFSITTQTANTVWAGPASGIAATPTFRALVAADIPALPYGTGTVTSFSAGALSPIFTTSVATATTTPALTFSLSTQTANTVLAGPASGVAAAPTFRALVAADIPAITVPWSSLINAAANLTLANAAFTTEFDQTTNAVWLWKNTTTGTALTTNASPLLELAANYFNVSSLQDTWTIGTSLAAGTNGLSTLTIAHSGSTAQATITLPPSATNVATPAITFGTATYGVGGSSASGLNVYTPSGAGNVAITGVVAGTTRWQIGCGDTSQTNDTFFLGTTVANWQMAFEHSVTTSTTLAAIRFIDNGTTGVGHMAATSGAQVHSSFEASFVPASGAASFACLRVQPTINQTSSSSGSYTGLLVNAIETSLKGTANKLISLQAGTTGGTVELDISNKGIVTTYNAIATVSNGVPSELATVDLTAQNAAISAHALYTPAATGMFRISWAADITTASDGSSVLGGATGFQVTFTSPTDSVSKTTVAGNSVVTSANTTGTAVGGSLVVYAKTGVAMTFSYGYTSVQTTTAMAYEVHVKVEAM